jgi:phosphoribosylglycinamide formyltransferase 1
MSTGEGAVPGEGAAAGEQSVFRVAVLASGSGSNLQALIDQVHQPRFPLAEQDLPPHAAPGCEWPVRDGGAAPAVPLPPAPRIEIVLVVSDNPGARALQRATHAGIPTATLPPADYQDREQHDLAVVAKLVAAEPDLVVLAGYMRIVAPSLLKAFPYRVINLHPALLPAFPGTHSIADAVRYGVKVTGVTVHFVDPGVDTGPIIAQEAVVVEDDDTAETLGARIHAAEHRLLPYVVCLIAAGRVRPPLPGIRVVQVD